MYFVQENPSSVLLQLESALKSDDSTIIKTLLNFSSYIERFPFSSYVSSCFYKLGECFNSGHDIHRDHVVKALLSCRNYIKLVTEFEEFFDQFYYVIHSTSSTSRIYTLKAFEALAPLFINVKNNDSNGEKSNYHFKILQSIMTCLESLDHEEVIVAASAACSFARISNHCSMMLVPKVVEMINTYPYKKNLNSKLIRVCANTYQDFVVGEFTYNNCVMCYGHLPKETLETVTDISIKYSLLSIKCFDYLISVWENCNDDIAFACIKCFSHLSEYQSDKFNDQQLLYKIWIKCTEKDYFGSSVHIYIFFANLIRNEVCEAIDFVGNQLEFLKCLLACLKDSAILFSISSLILIHAFKMEEVSTALFGTCLYIYFCFKNVEKVKKNNFSYMRNMIFDSVTTSRNEYMLLMKKFLIFQIAIKKEEFCISDEFWTKLFIKSPPNIEDINKLVKACIGSSGTYVHFCICKILFLIAMTTRNCTIVLSKYNMTTFYSVLDSHTYQSLLIDMDINKNENILIKNFFLVVCDVKTLCILAIYALEIGFCHLSKCVLQYLLKISPSHLKQLFQYYYSIAQLEYDIDQLTSKKNTDNFLLSLNRQLDVILRMKTLPNLNNQCSYEQINFKELYLKLRLKMLQVVRHLYTTVKGIKKDGKFFLASKTELVNLVMQVLETLLCLQKISVSSSKFTANLLAFYERIVRIILIISKAIQAEEKSIDDYTREELNLILEQSELFQAKICSTKWRSEFITRMRDLVNESSSARTILMNLVGCFMLTSFPIPEYFFTIDSHTTVQMFITHENSMQCDSTCMIYVDSMFTIQIEGMIKTREILRTDSKNGKILPSKRKFTKGYIQIYILGTGSQSSSRYCIAKNMVDINQDYFQLEVQASVEHLGEFTVYADFAYAIDECNTTWQIPGNSSKLSVHFVS